MVRIRSHNWYKIQADCNAGVWGFTELLKLNIYPVNWRPAKLKATSRWDTCPTYGATASLHSRFCSGHYV